MKLIRDYQFDQEKYEELRRRIYEYSTNNQDVDLDDVRNRITPPNNDNSNPPKCDWMLKRFLASGQKDVDVAFEKFLEFFRFRQPFKIAQMNAENSLFEEFCRLDAIVKGGHDKQDNQIMVIRLKFYKKISQLDLIIKRAIVYFFEQFDLDYEQQRLDGICLVIDCQQFSLMNLDLDMLHFVVKQIPFGYTGLVKNVLVYELPFLLSYILKIVESWLPTYIDKNGKKQKPFSVVTKKNIQDFIDEDQRDDYLNGKQPQESKEIFPCQKVLPFDEFIKTFPSELNETNVLKMSQHVDQLVKEYGDGAK